VDCVAARGSFESFVAAWADPRRRCSEGLVGGGVFYEGARHLTGPLCFLTQSTKYEES